ncbi:hypothetical protein BKN37_18510 [Mycobacterium talmoniae]|uniref:PPE domain-containing protein n=1 Tax=Mycobacterium talmoniae TaxID=1858794 RepID=A0A1S1NEB2_9MYCO|nr:hypothetical protein BKN37_18510 [Mycobacterium talmoniae]
MYAGAGSGPLLAAASAWDGLASELGSAATSYQGLVAELTGDSWQGPAAASMTAAATPYVTWMHTTATAAEQTANQARAAAAAYEAAFTATVPPPVIAANRALLMSLVATNFLGQNTPAIMATEAHYAEMWAQDAAAMYGYAGASATATTLTPFSPAPQNTNPAGVGAQAAAVGQAASTGGLAQAVATVPQALHGLASGTASVDPIASLLGMLDSPLGTALNTFAGAVGLPFEQLSSLPFLASGVIYQFAPLLTAGLASMGTAEASEVAGAAEGALGAGPVVSLIHIRRCRRLDRG